MGKLLPDPELERQVEKVNRRASRPEELESMLGGGTG